MKKYDVLLLDIDGTLLDFKKAEYNAFRETMCTFGIAYTDTLYSTYNDINKALWVALEKGEITKDALRTKRFSQLVESIGSCEDAVRISQTYEKALSQGAYLIDGAEELCKKMKEKHRLAVVTNGISSIQYNRLKKSGLKKYFEAIFVSEDLGVSKPQVEFFEKVFEKLDFHNAKRILIIGDSLSADIQGGKNAGIDTCWFNPEKLQRNEDVVPTYEIGHLNQLVERLS